MERRADVDNIEGAGFESRVPGSAAELEGAVLVGVEGEGRGGGGEEEEDGGGRGGGEEGGEGIFGI